MPIDKSCISLPVEAGRSLLDAIHLPSQLNTALEYVSGRLARRRLDISLIVLRGDEHNKIVQSAQSPSSVSSTPASSSSQSPSSSRSFRRSASKSSLSSLSSSTSSASSTTSFSRTNWPSLPASPKAGTSPQSAISPQPNTPASPNPYGITLVYASTLTEKAEKILRQSIIKAEKKFSIGTGWLSSQPSSTSTDSLVHRSLIQNEVLFSSEGLTLLAVDHVYTFKYRLHTYSRALSASDLTSAVDELRRLVLSQHGRQITKRYLMQAYPWLGFSLAAMVDVNEGYKVAYGGSQRFGGIELQSGERKLTPLVSGVKDGMRLKIQTNFQDCNNLARISNARSMADYGSIRFAGAREDKGPHFRGPSTPNQCDDFTPVTKGEWSYLMGDSGWSAAKTAAIESC